MKFKQVLKEATTCLKRKNKDTGIDPASMTGKYGEDVLPTAKEKKKKKKKK